jgi:lysophospholipase L1-like esterase
MKNLIKFLIICVIVAGCNSNSHIISPDNQKIEYTGRIDFSNPLAPKFSYSGVSIRAAFKGTSISATFDDNKGQNYYNILIDGVVTSVLKVDSGKKTYSLASVLKDGVHEIEIFKRTEEMFGKTTFLGFTLDEGRKLVKLKNARTKLFEFIGNSITCGYGNMGQLGGKFGASTENHYLTYAAFTSRSFNARHLAVCKSGIGIYRNYAGPDSGNWDCMPNLYQRIFLYDSLPLYDFKQKPDLIFIDLGTNDFSTPTGDSSLWVKNYLRFIDTIQVKYQQPEIICLLGPMLGGKDLDKVRNYLKTVVEIADKKGKGKVHFFEMSHQTGDLGIDYHPTVAQHIKNGRELVKFVSELKGWKASD